MKIYNIHTTYELIREDKSTTTLDSPKAVAKYDVPHMKLSHLLTIVILFPVFALAERKIPDTIHQANKQAEAILKRFEGKWEGVMKITTMQGDPITEFIVREKYWWDKDGITMKGLMSFDNKGSLEQAKSDNYIKNGTLYSKIKQDNKTILYKAHIKNNTITWLPLQRDMKPDHKSQVTFEETDTGWVMHQKSYERYEQGSIKTWIMINGDLHKLQEKKGSSRLP